MVHSQKLEFNEGNFEFEVKLKDETIAKGLISKKRINKFSRDFVKEAKERLKILGMDLEENKNKILNLVERKDLPNFLFIRSIFDYGGVAPSHVFEEIMLNLYKNRPFLFRLDDKIWTDMTPKAMQILLLPIAGLHRTRFEDIAKWWINVVNFLKKECEGDASNFFIRMAEKYDINRDEESSLEELHGKFIQDRQKIIPYGDKNGRLLIALLSKCERGFGVLKDVKPKHLYHFNLPVDSQVVRVSLNSGLLKFTYVKSKKYKLKVGKSQRSGKGININKVLLTQICQRAWKIVAEKIGCFPIDLDIYVWSVGTMLCKRFGKLCSLCPLKNICNSVERGYVGESRGVDWFKGCFCLGKPQLKAFAILRTCRECPEYDEKKGKCIRSKDYRIREINENEVKTLRGILKDRLLENA
jgi:hypothetical protein